MTGNKCVVVGLIGFGKARKPAIAAQCSECLSASCYYLVRIALMADIKYDPVDRAVIHSMNGDRKFYRS